MNSWVLNMESEKRKSFLASIKQQPQSLMSKINLREYEKKVEEEAKKGNINILGQCRYNSGTEK